MLPVNINEYRYTEGELPFEIQIDFDGDSHVIFENVDAFFIQNGKKYSFKNKNLNLTRSGYIIYKSTVYKLYCITYIP